VNAWLTFWRTILSPQTARFILALIALTMAQYAMHMLMGNEIKVANRDALMLALGIVLGLSKDAFGYYFGSTARNDERPTETRIVNDPAHAVPTTDVGEEAPKPVDNAG
jgi:hypothetical protein